MQSKEYRNTVPLTCCFFLPILILTEHWDKIKDTNNDHVHGQGFFYDICCGKVYQQTPGKDDTEKLISLVHHIDGAPAVKSKTMNLSPLKVLLSKYPGLWSFLHSKTARSESFPREICERVRAASALSSESWGRPGKHFCGKNCCTIGHLVDLVSKAPSLCFCQFNGKSGGSIRFIQVKKFSKEKGVFEFTLTLIS